MASSSSSSWHLDLCKALSNDDLSLARAILSRVEVRKNGNLGRKEWKNKIDEENLGSPLHDAARGGMTEMILAMAEAGFDVNSYAVLDVHGGKKDEGLDRMTGLHYAVWHDQREAVKCLLDLGADPKLEGSYGRIFGPLGTATEWARRMGRDAIERILLEHEAKMASSLEAAAKKILERSQEIKELVKTHRIEEKKVRVEVLQEEVRGLEERSRWNGMSMMTLQMETQRAEEKIRKEEVKMKILEVEKEKMRGRMRREEERMKALKESLMKLEEEEDNPSAGVILGLDTQLEVHLKSLLLKEDCPVCFAPPRQVFACQECDNWVCQDCSGKLFSCPTCRVDLTVTKMKRNRGMERLMGIP